MERNEERPDVRFWTAYDHFMFERDAHALRRKHARALVRLWWRRIAQQLKHAGAQPVKAQGRPA
jgi:hypothetical protein